MTYISKNIKFSNTTFSLKKGDTNFRSFSSEFKPLITYDDSLLNKFNALEGNKDRSGIYRWKHKTDNKSYIGSSINLQIRFRDYYNESFLNRRILTSNSCIYKALLHYGYKAFDLEILEYCDKLYIIEREQYYIDLLKPEYNIQSIAGIVIWPPRCTTTVINKKDNSVQIYATMRAAAKDMGINYSTFASYANRDKLLKGIYLIKTEPLRIKR